MILTLEEEIGINFGEADAVSDNCEMFWFLWGETFDVVAASVLTLNQRSL